MLLYAVTMSRRVRGSACRRIFHTSRASDAVTYEPGQIVEFHRMAKGVVRRGVQEKRFKSGEQWEVFRREEEAVIVGPGGSRSSHAGEVNGC